MKVQKITPRGYCKGVVSAIKIAKDCAKENKGQDISILGMIVHNQYIVDALKELGIKTIENKNSSRTQLLDEIDHGIVIITAHGASDEVFEKAKEKGLIIKDATCVDVIKTHDLIRKSIQDGFHILYIGKKGHPESEGTISIDTNNITLIESKADIDRLTDRSKKYLITNQTTMGLYDIYKIFEYAKEQLENLEIAQETCSATRVRQEAIYDLPKEIDIVFVVGDPHSNNTTRLEKIAKEIGKETHLIESVDDIDIHWLKDKKYAGVTSGASTPTYLTQLVISYLEQLDLNDIDTVNNKPVLDKSLILK